MAGYSPAREMMRRSLSQGQSLDSDSEGLRALCGVSLVTAVFPPLDESINGMRLSGVLVQERSVSPISTAEDIFEKSKVVLPLNLRGGLCSCPRQPRSWRYRNRVDKLIGKMSEVVNAADTVASAPSLAPSLQYLQKPSVDGLSVESLSTSEKVRYFALSALTLGIYAGCYHRKWKAEKQKFENGYPTLLGDRNICVTRKEVANLEAEVRKEAPKEEQGESSYGDYKMGVHNLGLAQRSHKIAKSMDEIYDYFENAADGSAVGAEVRPLPSSANSQWFCARRLLGFNAFSSFEKRKLKTQEDRKKGLEKLTDAMFFGHPRAWADGISLLVQGSSKLGLAPNREQAVSVMRSAVINGIVFSPYFYNEMKRSKWGKFFLSTDENGVYKPPEVSKNNPDEEGLFQDIKAIDRFISTVKGYRVGSNVMLKGERHRILSIIEDAYAKMRLEHMRKFMGNKGHGGLFSAFGEDKFSGATSTFPPYFNYLKDYTDVEIALTVHNEVQSECVDSLIKGLQEKHQSKLEEEKVAKEKESTERSEAATVKESSEGGASGKLKRRIWGGKPDTEVKASLKKGSEGKETERIGAVLQDSSAPVVNKKGRGLKKQAVSFIKGMKKRMLKS